MKKIAFYAPIKPPDHPIPSGDRLIAGNLEKALKKAGYETHLASRFIAYSKRDGADILASRKANALAEAQRLIDLYATIEKPSLPDLWLTYHPYCKAPDWIGPRIASALDIPYATVEAAKTGQGFENGADRWKNWREEAQLGLKQADLHICFKPTDRKYLRELLGSENKLRNLAPFFDVTIPLKRPHVSLPEHWRQDVPIMVVAGMMRPGKKPKNFFLLAKALETIQHLHWNLIIIGGGPEEKTIREFFKPIADERLLWTGEIPREMVLSFMAKGDLFVWPGWREPIGMVYLEAQLMGLPVAALNDMGAPLVVAHGKTGLLAENSKEAFIDSLTALLSHPKLRHDFARSARKYVQDKHSIKAASQSLKTLLDPLFLAKNETSL